VIQNKLDVIARQEREAAGKLLKARMDAVNEKVVAGQGVEKFGIV
jgi:hypothetical protein